MVDADVSDQPIAVARVADAVLVVRPRRRARVALILIGVMAGVIARLVVMQTSIGVLDSDEAVVGLMAHHFALGEFRAFFWGQAYGGTIETVLTAGLFRVFGMSTWALRVVPLALNGVAAVLAWRVARRLVSRRAAVVAAMLVWLWPANYIWWSIKARGFYEATFCLTLACALMALRIAQESGSRWTDWALFGLFAGLGWWQTPQIVYIVGPLAAWLVAVRRIAVWRAVAALPGLVMGALPWLVANVASRFASLVPPPVAGGTGYADHLVTFAREGLPMTLGLKVVYLSRWTTGPVAGELLYAVAAAAIVFGLLRRGPASLLIGGLVLAYPFLNALLTLSGVINEGRYTLFLLPWLAIAMARAADRGPVPMDRWPPPAGLVVLVVAAVVVSAIGLDALRGQTSPYGPDVHVPTSMTGLEQLLRDHGITRVWANYWVAYRLTFETHEAVIAAPVGNGRFPPYDAAVRAAARPAYVFVASSHDAALFRRNLVAHRVQYGEWTVGRDWVVYLPLPLPAPATIPGAYS